MSNITTDFMIELTDRSGILNLRPGVLTIGSRGDNEAQRLIFSRPDKYSGSDLILYFSPPSIPTKPINIGQLNEWTITADLTQSSPVQWQVAFMENGTELKKSNIAQLRLRNSTSNDFPSTKSVPSRLNDLEESAFTGMTYENSTLTLSTSTGQEESVVIEGGGGGSGGAVWLPTVQNTATESLLSWEKSSTTTPPAVVDIRGAQGIPGTDGLQGETGQQGPIGPMGPPGEIGPQGQQGIQGIPGEKGDPGPNEISGTTGVTGIDDGKLLGVSGGKVVGMDGSVGAEISDNTPVSGISDGAFLGVDGGKVIGIQGTAPCVVGDVESVVPGFYWRNKPVYAREAYIPALPNNTTLDVSLGDYGAEAFYGVSGIAISASTGTHLPLPHVDTATLASQMSVYVRREGGDSIRVITKSDRTGYAGYVRVMYIKAADEEANPDALSPLAIGGAGSGAGKDYVDAQDAETLQRAKAYTDQHAGGSASTVNRKLIAEGGRVTEIPFKKTVPATLTHIHTGNDPISGATLQITTSNTLAISDISTGTYNGVAVTVNEDSGTVTVSGSTGDTAVRLKITGGFEGTTSPIPQAWRDERLFRPAEQSYFSCSEIKTTGSVTCNVNVLYGDESSLSLPVSSVPWGGFAEARTTGGKNLGCISVYYQSEVAGSSISFKIMRSKEMVGDKYGFSVGKRTLYPLESQPANKVTSPLLSVELYPGGTIDVMGGPKPYKLVFAYRDQELVGRTDKRFCLSNVPVIPYTAPDGIYLAQNDIDSMDYAGVIALYDALLPLGGGYISKRVIGATSTGEDLAAYRFNPALPVDKKANNPTQLPKITLTAGIHSDERAAWASAYLFFQQIISNWKDDPALEFLRFHALFEVVPIINPYMDRVTPFGVNMNRNFYPNWESGTLGGATPLSEPEAQAIYRFLADSNTDFHIDCHNMYAEEPTMFDAYLAGDEGSMVHADTLTRVTQGVCTDATTATYRSWQRRNESYLGTGYNSVKANVGLSPHGGVGTVTQQVRALGLNGITLETRWQFTEKAGSKPHDADAQQMALEHLVNTVLAVLKYLSK